MLPRSNSGILGTDWEYGLRDLHPLEYCNWISIIKYPKVFGGVEFDTVFLKRESNNVFLDFKFDRFDLGLNLEWKFIFIVDYIFDVSDKLLLNLRGEYYVETCLFSSRYNLQFLIWIRNFVMSYDKFHRDRLRKIVSHLNLLNFTLKYFSLTLLINTIPKSMYLGPVKIFYKSSPVISKLQSFSSA